MINYIKIRENTRQFLATTSLYVEEFDVLLPYFVSEWYKFYRQYKTNGERRKAPNSNPMKDTKTLPTVEDKLFFILSYLKNNTLQNFHGISFGMSQGKASRWIKILKETLEVALSKMGVLPNREGQALASIIEDLGIKTVLQDATERGIQRNKDQGVQEDEFSGKAHDHNIKNHIVSTKDQEVIFLGYTCSGSVSDKKIVDEAELTFPKGIYLMDDRGYQGYNPEAVHVQRPIKKPKNREYTKLKKWFNKTVSSVRISVEHVMSGVKRCRIVKERCRYYSRDFRDSIILLCTALHNLRVRSPYRNYDTPTSRLWGTRLTHA
jgi:hypothetical protein